VGNSGNSSEPHLHYHLQDGPVFADAESMPAAFVDYLADDRPVASGELHKGQRVRTRNSAAAAAHVAGAGSVWFPTCYFDYAGSPRHEAVLLPVCAGF
jgi:hypothetical protein